jgi:hypothetical protein
MPAQVGNRGGGRIVIDDHGSAPSDGSIV